FRHTSRSTLFPYTTLFRSAILEASLWIKRLNANVTLHAADALTYEGIHKTYDLIFIDAAKSQYETLFNKYSKYLNDGGTIICDKDRKSTRLNSSHVKISYA